MRGLRVRGLAVQGTPANLSAPLTAKRRQTASCSADRMLAQNLPSSAMTGQVAEDRDTLSDTSGGLSDSEANDWMDSPTGRPSCRAAMITIPDAKWPSVVRKSGVPSAGFEVTPVAVGQFIARVITPSSASIGTPISQDQ
jgi:hypothetical protein